MLETIKYATISNIYTKDLTFYNPHEKEKLIKTCKKNGYTFLPSEDRTSCYKLVDSDFENIPLTDDLICKPFDRIFNEKIIKKFENNIHDEVLFAVEDNKIRGVVHIVDFNTEFINYEFYKATYQFEVKLRNFLSSKRNETNESLLHWMKEKAISDKFWKKRHSQCVPNNESKLNELEARRRDCSPFQTFYLNDLLYFAASKNYISDEFILAIEPIKKIRNWVAHNQDLAIKSQTNKAPLYKIDELSEFVKNANLFFKCFEELEDK